MKKIISALMLFFICSQPAFAKDIFFTDVIDSNPYKESILELYNSGVVKGYSNNLFRPDNEINRAEFLKILLDMREISPFSGNCFSDVNSQWFAGYVCVAYDLGLISGYPDGTFKPDKNISLAEASALLVKLFRIKPASISKANSEWYEPYVTALNLIGVVPNELKKPDQFLTRAQFAHLIVQIKKNGPYLEEIQTGNSEMVYFLKDNQNVYDAFSHEIIEDLNPKNFTVNEFELYPFGNTILYGKSSNKFWYFALDKVGYGPLIINDEIDPDSFEIVSTIFYEKFEDESIYKLKYDHHGKDLCESVKATYKPMNDSINADPTFIREYLTFSTDKTFCSLIQEYKKESGVYEKSALFFKDKRSLYLLDEDSSEITKIEHNKIDAKSFERIDDYNLYRDKNRLYYFVDDKLTLIPQADPDSLQIFENDSRDKLVYIKDQSNEWSFDTKLKKFIKKN